VLRVVGFYRRWGSGRSPVVELVGSGGPGYRPVAADLVGAEARQTAHPLTLTSGRAWQGTRFKVGVFEPGTYYPGRVRRMKPVSRSWRFPTTQVEPIGQGRDKASAYVAEHPEIAEEVRRLLLEARKAEDAALGAPVMAPAQAQAA
jgi:hypothetical protein